MTDLPSVAPVAAPWPDWRDAEQYRYMVDLDRAGWAWEWLRRSPGYAHGSVDGPPPDRGGKTQLGSGFLHLATDPTALRWGLCFRRGAESPGAARATVMGF